MFKGNLHARIYCKPDTTLLEKRLAPLLLQVSSLYTFCKIIVFNIQCCIIIFYSNVQITIIHDIVRVTLRKFIAVEIFTLVSIVACICIIVVTCACTAFVLY